MKKLTLFMISVWSFIGLIIIAAIIFTTISTNSGKGVGFTMMHFTDADTSNMPIVAEANVPMAGVKKVELELFSDNCGIYFVEGDSIEMKHYARNVPQGQYARAQMVGDTLHITTKPQSIGGFFSINLISRSTVDILLPEAYREALFINLASGSLSINDKAKLDSLSVKLSSGTIHSGYPVEARDVAITVTSGTVKLTGGVKADQYAMKTSSGNLTIDEHLTGSGSVTVTSGTVKLAGVDITDSLDVKVSSGNLNIGLANDPSLQFTGKVSSGTVRSYFNSQKDGSHYTATVGTAPYKNLNVQVTSGTIRITQD